MSLRYFFSFLFCSPATLPLPYPHSPSTCHPAAPPPHLPFRIIHRTLKLCRFCLNILSHDAASLSTQILMAGWSHLVYLGCPLQCPCVRLSVCMYVSKSACMCNYLPIWVTLPVCFSSNVCDCLYVCISVLCVCLSTCMCVRVCLLHFFSTSVNVCVCLCVCEPVYLSICVHCLRLSHSVFVNYSLKQWKKQTLKRKLKEKRKREDADQ